MFLPPCYVGDKHPETHTAQEPHQTLPTRLFPPDSSHQTLPTRHFPLSLIQLCITPPEPNEL